MIKVALVDDHPILLEGIQSILEKTGEIRVTHRFGSAAEFLVRLEAVEADIVLVDVNLPKMNGLEFSKKLLELRPNAKIVILTMHNRKDYLNYALELGAKGYILKDIAGDEMIRVVKSVHYGLSRFCCTVDGTGEWRQGEKDGGGKMLTERQREVLKLVGNGLTNKEISAKLFISQRTVEAHRNNIKEKLGVKNLSELIACALRLNPPEGY